jgi:hypothetical protein
MADFALWATACERNLWPAGTFTRAYGANRKAAIEGIIDTDPIAACVREFMRERSYWTGSAADLLRISVERAAQVGDNIGWLKNPRALAGRLRRAQTSLRALGVDISFSREGSNGSRVIRMRSSFENTVSTVSSVCTGPEPVPELRPLGSASVPCENHRTDTRPTLAASTKMADGADGADAKCNFPFL